MGRTRGEWLLWKEKTGHLYAVVWKARNGGVASRIVHEDELETLLKQLDDKKLIKIYQFQPQMLIRRQRKVSAKQVKFATSLQKLF